MVFAHPASNGKITFLFHILILNFMTPTSELLLSAETIILGFAVARLLHGAREYLH